MQQYAIKHLANKEAGMEIKDIRLKNLQTVIQRSGLTQTDLALKCEISPSLISQIMTKRRNMGTALARKLEGRLSLSEGWFDIPHSLLDSPWHLAKMSEKTGAVAIDEQQLTKRETRLIELFRQMPESEKDRIISDLSEKKRNFDKLLDELMAVKASRMPIDKNENE
ncbi:helix-turn-helix domain-containing protein [Klebsiella grimontii]|uniref:helix-turn-helix domain-containing protein n=2 Tax=Klebsiella/Raoultella group TaxID=2890311 RepID=UPI00293490BF|nr:helix-turn-helix domain-containing protein [Klebsiella grimontii]